jgi:hypothetical protein
VLPSVPRQIIEAASEEKDLVVASFALAGDDDDPRPNFDVVIAENGLVMPAVAEVTTVFSRCLGDRTPVATDAPHSWGDLTDSFVAHLLRQNGVIRRVAASTD